MDLTEDDVIHILQLMAASRFDELHLEMGDLKIVVNKHGGPGTLTQPPTPVTPMTVHEVHEDKPHRGEDFVAEGLVAIPAPMLGIYYQAPKPGAPPFVEVGTVVDEDTTVCIIEVMKLFTTIKAGRCGRITKICAANGQLVEYNQVLFLLEPHPHRQGG